MTRRDAFSHLPLTLPADPGDEDQPTQSTPPFEPETVSHPLDLIPRAAPRKRRSRQWEAVHRAETVTYRGVPTEVQEQVTQIADSLCVSRDEIVQAFFAYAIEGYQNGSLQLMAHPKAQRMTLFPERNSGSTHGPMKTGWLTEAYSTPLKRKANSPKKKQANTPNAPDWKSRVTYRIPVPLKEAIRSIAREHTVPIGEVVWFFFLLAIQALAAGDLSLHPTPKITGNTLFPD